MTTKDYKNILDKIPTNPGVYKFINEDGVILYVGKAKNIRKRVASYFGEKKHQRFKTKALVRNADHMEFTIVETEHDALLLENTLIKKFQPRYNVSLKDGKSYTYICIKKERFPRVFFTRRVIRDGSTYFGPYTSKHRINSIVEVIKTLFPLRTCKFLLTEENIQKNKFKVCLEYHLKNCEGPCEGLEEEANYNSKIEQIINILKGNFKPVRSYIEDNMALYAEQMKFEEANNLKEKLFYLKDYQAKSTVVSATIKDLDVFAFQREEQMSYIAYLKVVNGSLINTDIVEVEQQVLEEDQEILSFTIDRLREKYNSIAPEIIVPFKTQTTDINLKLTIPKRGEKHNLLLLAEKNLNYFVLQKRKEKINHIKKITSTERILTTLKNDLSMNEMPFHIECFDNSNIQGTHPVSSCVVFKNAKPSKKDYRKFKIKTVVGPDDFGSMREVVYRRYKRLLEEKKPLPQLIVIDGGKGQLSAALESLVDLNLENRIAIIGIAKRLEEIFFPNDSIPIYINKKSESLKLIQHLRNEAHRFAINFHRDQRSSSFLQTSLTDIPGIGQKTAEKLLKEYGSLKRIKEVEPDQLIKFAGLSVSKKIQSYFSEEE